MHSLSEQLQQWATGQNLNPYRITQLIAAETDPTNREFKRIQKRWERVLNGENFRVQDIEADMELLGLKLRLVDLR
ncbi:MAG: hypothetical protein AAGD09_03185 [Cyanobacteria bacterium P01_F01_bin.56]